MEHTTIRKQNLHKAKELSGYIQAVYGIKELGIVRLLSSVAYFRQSVYQNGLKQLLGMSLISFERYLREAYNIIYGYNGSTFHIDRLDGGSAIRIAEFADDDIFSVGGAVVDKIKGLYPDADAFCSVPLVSLGRGAGVDGLFDRIDLQGICAMCADLQSDYIDEHQLADNITALDDYRTLVEAEEEIPVVIKYKAIEALHDLYVTLRLHPIDIKNEQELPACGNDDIMSVIMGIKKCSVSPPEGGVLPSALLNLLQEVHPEGNVVEGKFVITGDVIIDPFSYVHSKQFDIVIPDFVTAEAIRPAEPVAAAGSSRIIPAAASGQVGSIGPGYEAALALIYAYVDTDINSLPDGEKELALYGFVGGHAIFKKISANSIRQMARLIPVGSHESYEVISRLATFLRTHLRIRMKITEEQCALLAAGRIVAWKGNWEIDATGIWQRIR